MRGRLNGPAAALIAGLAFNLFSPHAHADTQEPAFTIGDKHQVKNILIFVWSADSVESASAYQNVISPLGSDIKQGDLFVLALQLDSGSRHDHDTGPLFLCAQPEDYPRLAMKYLKQFNDNFTEVGKWQVADTLTEVGRQFALPARIVACHDGREGKARRDRLAGAVAAIRSALGVSSAPAFLFNSKRVYPASADDVRALIAQKSLKK